MDEQQLQARLREIDAMSGMIPEAAKEQLRMEAREEFRKAEEERKGIAATEAERAEMLEETRGEAQRSLGELERLIQTSGAAQRRLAERVGARSTGQLMGQLERAILGAGGDPQVVMSLVPGVQEQAERTLLDRLNTIEAQTSQQLQQVPRLGLQQATTMAQLQQQQQRISDAMERARMSQELGMAQIETQRARTQAELDRQPEWWEGILGAAGTAIGTAVGGPLGGAIGGALTGALRNPRSFRRPASGDNTFVGEGVTYINDSF